VRLLLANESHDLVFASQSAHRSGIGAAGGLKAFVIIIPSRRNRECESGSVKGEIQRGDRELVFKLSDRPWIEFLYHNYCSDQ